MQNKIITHINFAKGFRGGERQTLLLIKELSKRGYTQTLLVRKKSELISKLKGTKNLLIKEISKPYLLSISSVKNSSILHAHETKAAQFCYFANMMYKIPYIITRRVDNPIKNNFLNKNIYEKSSYTVALSQAIKKGLEKISKKINVKIIPSAYSTLQVDSNISQQINNRFKNNFLIGNIGELDNEHKGQYYLLEAMKKLQITHPNIHLILLGKGKDKQKYKEQVQDLSNVTFEGFVSNVGDYINCLDLFVFPSLHEGLGSILFDIMQRDVPIAASNTGGIPDIITDGKNGILFPIKNSDAIYENIIKLYKDDILRKTLSSNALANIDKYSYISMSDSYDKLYKKILDNEN